MSPVSNCELECVVYHSPESLVDAFVDVEGPRLSARSSFESLHAAGEETPDFGVVQVREHIGKCTWVLLYCSWRWDEMMFATPRPLPSFYPQGTGGYVTV